MKATMIKVAVCTALLAFINFACAKAPEPESEPVINESGASSPNAYLKVDEKNQGVQENGLMPAPIAHKYRIYQYMPESSRSQATESQLSDISKEVAGKVFYELKEDGEKNYSARVAVVAAVPLSDLKRDTEFGRVMAEYLLTDLADRGLKVTELRLGKEINIIAQTGEFILTQNVGELANIAPELEYVVVSTFSNTRKTLIVQGRLVSLQDGLVKSSWRYTMPFTRDLLAFFQGGEQPLTIAVRGTNN
ncbi:MAG: FlgO family outer membrane protein [Thermodesulfobacteriota bacterium]|jgi:TolB-like protein